MRSVVNKHRGQVVSFGYDFAGQLTGEIRSGTGGYTTSYTYDNAGNRLIKTVNGVAESYTYDNANKLLTAGVKSYTYDAAGNTKTVTTGANVTTLTWNAAGMMTGIAYPGGATNTFTYNGLKQRVGKTDSTGTFSYTLTDDSIDSTPVADGAATYRQALGLLGEVRGGAKRYYNSDALGSTRAIADATGNVSATKETDAFGNTVASSGTTPEYGYGAQSGYRDDGDAGLVHIGARYYDAQVGLFTTRDTYLSEKPYQYCNNDPVNYTDPSGHARDWGAGGVAAAIFAALFVVLFTPAAVAATGVIAVGVVAVVVGITAIGILAGVDFGGSIDWPWNTDWGPTTKRQLDFYKAVGILSENPTGHEIF